MIDISGFASVLERVGRLQRLLVEAYDHYFGYAKAQVAGEGSVTLVWPAFSELAAGDVEPSVSIVSSVFGDGGVHQFETLDLALAAVERWHSAELSNEPDTDSWFKDADEWD